MVLMREVVDTKQHNWIVHGTAGIGVAICVAMVKHWSSYSSKFQIFGHFCMNVSCEIG